MADFLLQAVYDTLTKMLKCNVKKLLAIYNQHVLNAFDNIAVPIAVKFDEIPCII